MSDERRSEIIEPVFNLEDVKLFADMTRAIMRGFYRTHDLPRDEAVQKAVVFLAQVQAWQTCLLREAAKAQAALREKLGIKLQ